VREGAFGGRHPSPARKRARRSLRPPESLVALLVAAFVVACTWALIVPPWQVPDEEAHFAYVQSLAERHRLPGDPFTRQGSTEQRLATALSRADLIRGAPSRKPEWDAAIYRQWRRLDEALPDSARRDGGGPSRARNNPPAYYLFEVPPYLLASEGDIFARLYLARLWSALLVLVTVSATWLLVGEMMCRDRLLQSCAAAAVGLQPMVSFISGSVNPDAMLLAAWSVALWLGVRLLTSGLTAANAIALIAAVSTAAAVKAAGYALLPAAGFALAVSLVRAGGLRKVLFAAGVAMAAAVAIALATASTTLGSAVGNLQLLPDGLASVRGFASYLWQFYLPRAPFMGELHALPSLAGYTTWAADSWAAFGWGEVRFPGPIYGAAAAVAAVVVSAAVVRVLRWPHGNDKAAVVFLALAAAALLAGLHWTDYRVATGDSDFSRALVDARQIPLNGQADNPVLKGRYLLPLAPLWGLAWAYALCWLPATRRGAAAAVLLACLLVVQVAALGLVAGRFYA
jgi:4-amino-4-deoxy-L-arabinose transferase-like glycosyltransferase